MQTFTTNKDRTISFKDVNLVSISTMPVDRKTVDRAIVSHGGDAELFGGEVWGFQKAFAAWQYKQNNE